MSKCRQCGVEVIDQAFACPLCKCVLEQNENVANTYPNIRLMAKKINFVLRIFFFFSIIVEILLVYLNYRYFNGFWWSIITGAGLAYTCFIFRFAVVNTRMGYKAKIITSTILGVMYVVLIDEVIGFRGWSVNYVLPGTLLFVDAGIVFLMLINLRNWQSYMMFELFMILLSTIPLLLVRLEIITSPFISYLAFIVSILLFLGTVIIGDRRARMELKRRFHVR